MPDAELGFALIVSGVAFLLGTVLASAWGDPDVDYSALLAVAGGLFGLGLIVCLLRLLPARLRSMTTSARRSAGGGPPHETNLRASLEASHAMIRNQFLTCGSLEAQLVGFVAALVAGLGLFAAVPHSLHAQRWVLLSGDFAALTICLAGLFFTGKLKSGRPPASFYEDYGAEEPPEYLGRFVSTLNRTIGLNDEAILRRQGALALAIVILLVAAAVWGAARLVVI
jgi:hypothetical protein